MQELDPKKPLVLLLGNVAHEGVVSALSAAGRQYKQKYPESQAENWLRILRYFHRFSVRQVIWKVSPSAYELLAHPNYQDVRDELLPKITAVPHVLFVHQDILSGKFDSEWSMEFPQPAAEVRSKVHSLFETHGLNVIPYARNAELTVLAAEFIADTEQGLLLRVYVPSGRMWSQETDRLLQLFRDYLARVSQFSVRLDQTRTDRGVIYEFHGEEGSPHLDLSSEFGEFSHLLDLCISHPDQASSLLSDRELPQREIADILARYAKEAKRIQVDLKHDRERKLLGIRQRLESELVDLSVASGTWSEIEALVDLAVPRVTGLGSAVAVDQSPLRLPGSTGSSVTVNLNPQIVQTVGGIVAREIRGDAHLTENDQELLALIQQYAGRESAELASAVHELGDPSAPKPGRLVAKQKLVKFLIGVGSRLGDVATGVLQSYLEAKLGI